MVHGALLTMAYLWFNETELWKPFNNQQVCLCFNPSLSPVLAYLPTSHLLASCKWMIHSRMAHTSSITNKMGLWKPFNNHMYHVPCTLVHCISYHAYSIVIVAVTQHHRGHIRSNQATNRRAHLSPTQQHLSSVCTSWPLQGCCMVVVIVM